MHVAVALGDAEDQEEEREQLGRGVGIDLRQRTAHTLGPPGGARRVVHRRAGRAIFGRGRRLAVDDLGERAEAGDRAVREPRFRRDPGLVGRRGRERGEPLVAHEGLGVAVAQDVRDLRRAQPVVDRHVVPTGLERGEVDVHRVRAVGQHRGDRVAGLQPDLAQGVHDLVGPGEHVAGAVLGTVGIDDREVVRIGLRTSRIPTSVPRGTTSWSAR